MTVLAFASAKGSPGVTTTVLALAASWPAAREPVVIELDPSGGDLAAWLSPTGEGADGLRETPSTVHLAAASRSGLTAVTLAEHLQRLPGPGEVRCLTGPAASSAASTAASALSTGPLAAHLKAQHGVDALIDLGRLDTTSPAIPVVREIGVVVIVLRPNLPAVAHAQALAGSLRSMAVTPLLAVIGDRPYRPVDVTGVIEDAALLLELPHDPVGAAGLRGEGRGARVLSRTSLVRAARAAAGRLCESPVGPAGEPESFECRPGPALLGSLAHRTPVVAP
jgi:hypothetical protein